MLFRQPLAVWFIYEPVSRDCLAEARQTPTFSGAGKGKEVGEADTAGEADTPCQPSCTVA
jgi:hypothetical protein